MTKSYSLLRDIPPLRSLGVALAQCMTSAMEAKNAARIDLLDVVYTFSKPAVQLEAQAELRAIRAAKRGETLAEVV